MSEQTENKGKIITGLFKDHLKAERAYQNLLDKGYDRKDIHLVMSDDTKTRYFSNADEATVIESGTKALEGTGAGSIVGGTVGAIAGAILAAGTSVVFPGLGLVVSGPLMAAMAGGGVGAFTGGVLGSMVGATIPDEKAKLYEEGVKAGGIVVGVNPRSMEDAANFQRQWTDMQADNVYAA